jgi:integrative and conjugative element protein (TIGR02256 family)
MTGTTRGSSAPPVAEPSEGQRQALAELDLIAGHGEGLTLMGRRGPLEAGGAVAVEVSLRCADRPRATTGIALHARERVTLLVPAQFPFELPTVHARHRRFERAQHVQWRRQICLYRSPATEWDPSDGMFGFIERLGDWFAAAAAGNLDAPGQPLHPPAAYADPTAGVVVVRADAPTPTEGPWLGAVLVHRVARHRIDLLAWLPLGARWPRTPDGARAAAGIPGSYGVLSLAPAVLAPHAIGYTEYPDTAAALLDALGTAGAPPLRVLALIGRTVRHNRDLAPEPSETGGGERGAPDLSALLVVGDPTRGIAGPGGPRIPHLAVWALPGITQQMAALMPAYLSLNPAIAEKVADVLDAGHAALRDIATRWLPVDEARPQVTVRRDAHTAADWLQGRRVLLLGAGALGAPIADMCARGGVAHLEVVDNGVVHHGVLVRQPYADTDIGVGKAAALARRLRADHPHLDVVDRPVGARARLASPAADLSFDIIIDATANRVVRAALERERHHRRTAWPAHVTMMIGPTAARGLATISAAGTTGGGADVLRRVGLIAHAETTTAATDTVPEGLGDVAADFFPTAAPELFTPEPGCSDATFIGSAADTTALVGQLFTAALRALAAPQPPAMAAVVVYTPTGPCEPAVPGPRWMTWPDDTLVHETSGYEVRLRGEALKAIHAEVRTSAARRPRTVETGGTLLGAIDDAVKVIWVDTATGPPPDSRMSTVGFCHGTHGLDDLLATHHDRSNGASQFLGVWHTHPGATARPSATDHAGMAQLVGTLDDGPHRALMLIVGGAPTTWQAYLEGAAQPELAAELVTRIESTTAPPDPPASWATAHWWSPADTDPASHATASPTTSTTDMHSSARDHAAVRGRLRRELHNADHSGPPPHEGAQS